MKKFGIKECIVLGASYVQESKKQSYSELHIQREFWSSF